MKDVAYKEILKENGEKEFKCNKCEAVYQKVDSVRRHFHHVHGDKKFKCDNCDKMFHAEMSLIRHKKYCFNQTDTESRIEIEPRIETEPSTVKGSNSLIRDPSDPKPTFEDDDRIERNRIENAEHHIREDSNDSIPELDTDPDITIETPLENETSDFDDDFSDTRILMEIDKNEPQTLVEAPKTEVFCKPCDKSFPSELDLGMHVKFAHSVTSLKCPKCPKLFLTQQEFIVHDCTEVQEIEMKVPVGNCETCGQTFSHKQSCRMHEILAH